MKSDKYIELIVLVDENIWNFRRFKQNTIVLGTGILPTEQNIRLVIISMKSQIE